MDFQDCKARQVFQLLIHLDPRDHPVSQESKEIQVSRGLFSSGPQDKQASLEFRDLKENREIPDYQISRRVELDFQVPKG